MNRRQQYLWGVRYGLPVVLGFIPVGIAYAIMGSQCGLDILQINIMSISVFAGASQMMAVNMFAMGAGMIEIILATFILNLRHMIMSTCVMNRLKGTRISRKLVLAFGITDESFAIFATIDEKKCTPFFFAGLISTTYSAWIVGTFLGSVASQFLPGIVADSLGIALYAMFIGLLVPNIRENLRLGLVVLISICINVLFSQFMTTSWSIICTTLIGALIGVFVVEDKEELHSMEEVKTG